MRSKRAVRLEKKEATDEDEEEEAVDTDFEEEKTALSVDAIERTACKTNNLSQIALKADHRQRPLWIDGNFRIYFESFSPIAEQAQELLVSIAEPVTRPRNIHEYKLTEYSLYAASSIGLDTDAILQGLEKLCKSELPAKVVNFIKASTKSYAKVKLILKDNSYWLESRDEAVLKRLLMQDDIAAARVVLNDQETDTFTVSREQEGTFIIPMAKKPAFSKKENLGVNVNVPPVDLGQEKPDASLLDFFDNGNDDDVEIDENDEFKDVDPDQVDLNEQEKESHLVHSFEIKKESVDIVKEKCSELQYPILEEYDFRADKANASLEIDLKPKAKLRPYQETCLAKMFGNGRARSGIIVLPCGSGKTLVGITAAATIKKSVLVLCNSSLSVEQWAKEFRHWSTIKDTDLAKFSSETKDKFRYGVLLL